MTAALRRWLDEHPTTPLDSPWTPDRDGALCAVVPLTWVGVREYIRDGQRVRILRRPEIINSQAHLDLLGMVTPTHGHPLDAAGKPVWVTPDNFARLNVGHIGDQVQTATIAGVDVPIARARVFAPGCKDAILGGFIGASLGYFCAEVDAHPREIETVKGDPVGVWIGPDGPQPYDLEHLPCPAYLADSDDPRVLALRREGEIDDAAIELLGPNHEALGIPEGRGAELTEIRPATDSSPPPAAGRSSVYFRRRDDEDDMSDTKTRPHRISRSIDGPDGRPVEFTLDMELSEEDARKLGALLDDAMKMLADARMMLGEEQGARAAAEAEAEDAKMAAEAAEKAAEEAKVEVENAKAEVDKANAERDELKVAIAGMKAQLANADQALAPVRAKALEDAKARAKSMMGARGPSVDALDTVEAVKRVAVELLDPDMKGATDGEIGAYWRAVKAPATSDTTEGVFQFGSPRDAVRSQPIGDSTSAGQHIFDQQLAAVNGG